MQQVVSALDGPPFAADDGTRARHRDVGARAVELDEHVADVVGHGAHERHEVRDGSGRRLLPLRRGGQDEVELQPVAVATSARPT